MTATDHLSGARFVFGHFNAGHAALYAIDAAAHAAHANAAAASAVHAAAGFGSIHAPPIDIAPVAHADADVARAAIWGSVRADCLTLLDAGPNGVAPLWHGARDGAERAWHDLRQQLPQNHPGAQDETARAPAAEDWSFWIRWYEAALEGRPMNLDMLTEIALIPPETWDKGPGVVNPMIADIEVKYLRRGTWNAERIIVNEATHRLKVEPTSPLGPGNLQDVQEKMRGAAEAFDGEGGANGPYGAVAQEVEMVRKAAGRNDPRPIYLYDICRRAMRRAASKAQRGDCPDDAPLEDFLSQLDEASSDIRTFNEDVDRVAASRAERKILEAGEGARDVLLAGAEEVAAVSEGDLAEELPQDALLATDPDATREERDVARYRLASRMSRIWSGAKRGVRMITDETDDIAKRSKTIATIIESSKAIWATIRYLIGLF